MRYLKYFIIGLFILSTSCAGMNKRLKKSSSESTPPVIEQPAPLQEPEKLPEAKPPVKEVNEVKEAREVEEKLVPFEQTAPNPLRFFVIVGSFRDPANAKKRQKELLNESFTSEILKNEAGLLRVSVLATDEIDVARDYIRRIKSVSPDYFDAWLLIQKK